MGDEAGTLTAVERILLRQASAWFDAHSGEFVDDLLQWVAVPSVSDVSTAADGQPYGPGVAAIFAKAAARAAEFGLDGIDREGHALEIRLNGTLSDGTRSDAPDNVEGESRPGHGPGLGAIALVAHVDVVPPGKGWSSDPFDPYLRDGYVVGRGAADDKLGALVDLYLLRFLKEHDLPLRHPVRIIYGGAEETGMDDLRYYVERYGAPRQAIVTDGPFPANNAQKGHLIAHVSLPVGPVLSRLEAGSALNAIPGVASVSLPADVGNQRKLDVHTVSDALEHVDEGLRSRIDVRASADGGGIILTARGIAGHSAFPDGTINAIPLLTRALSVIDEQLDVLDSADRNAAQAVCALSASPYASGTPIAYKDRESGHTTQNLGLARPGDDGASVSLTIDFRYAVTQSNDDLERAVASAWRSYGAGISFSGQAEPFFVPEDDDRLQALLSAYNDVVGVHERPNAMGGGTHVRVIPHALNFGPRFADLRDASGKPLSPRPSFVEEGKGSAHGADEWASLADAKRAFLIYAIGLIRLDAVLDA